jgi:hypothetical protein
MHGFLEAKSVIFGFIKKLVASIESLSDFIEELKTNFFKILKLEENLWVLGKDHIFSQNIFIEKNLFFFILRSALYI